jgi:hypothetical protein
LKRKRRWRGFEKKKEALLMGFIVPLLAVAGAAASYAQAKKQEKAAEAAARQAAYNTPDAPTVKSEAIEDSQNMAAYNKALQRRRFAAMSRSDTRGGGAMQGADSAGGKTKLGE